MRTHCIICESEFVLSIDEFIQIEEEIDDYVCDNCAEICIKQAPVWWKELQLRLN